MREIDFAGLREAGQGAFKPEFDDVERRARRLRRSRGWGAAVLAVAVVAGAGVAWADLLPRGGQGQPGPAAPVSTPDFIATPAPSGSPTAAQPMRGYVVAGDQQHLYMAFAGCRDAGPDCSPAVAVTENGGQDWRKASLPAPNGSRLVLKAVAPRTLLAWVDPAETGPPGTESYGTPFWLASTDGASTWRTVALTEAPSMPDGFEPLAEVVPNDPPQVLAANPATGDMVRLARTANLEQARLHDEIPPGDGLWVTGYLGHHLSNDTFIFEDSAVAVSVDGGRSWHRTALPAHIEAMEDQGADLALSRDAAYAVGRADGELHVYRSIDRGRSWQRTAARAQVGDRWIQAAVRPDGTLLIQAGLLAGQDPIMFASTDRGETLAEVEPGPGAAAFAVQGGYAQTGTQDQRGVWLSTDGTTWSYVGPPTMR